MDRTPTRRPRRLRALLVAAALGASVFATALPAAAAPPAHAGPPAWLFQDGQITPQGFTWLRSLEVGSQGFTWLQSVSADEVVIEVEAEDGMFTTQGFTWLR